jgi:hypothetical protein
MLHPFLAVIPHAAVVALIVFSALALAMANPSQPNVQDASLIVTLALPGAASTTVTSTGLDLGVASSNAILPAVELLLTVPALTTTQLPDTDTVTYAILVSASIGLGTPATLLPTVIVQTGAGGAGAAGATYRFRLPDSIGAGNRYIGFTSTTGSGTGNCSAKSATLQMVF